VNGDGNGGRQILADAVDGSTCIASLKTFAGRSDDQRPILHDP
jgi:hypothetical protein